MNDFKSLSAQFIKQFEQEHFPAEPATLYDPNRYFLSLGGKRIRPVMVLLGNLLFDALHADAFKVANAVELFHNFTLIHDDIMDAAAIRRGLPTVHEKYGANTAILAGDVMLIRAYEYLNAIDKTVMRQIIGLFNKTAAEVCEGQQLDVDFEKMNEVSLDAYLHMIRLKTSVLLASALQMGAVLGGAGKGNQDHIYAFGQDLGIAFQIQDDYLDAFGDPAKVGKETGGDIRQNKKTFLAIKTRMTANADQAKRLDALATTNGPEKITETLAIMRACGVDEWAKDLKQQYYDRAMQHLEAIAVLSNRKGELRQLADFLLQRDY